MMTATDNDGQKKLKRYETSVSIRNFEIELFWKRAQFFWAFNIAAFAGYAALRKDKSDISIIVACFGMVCSAAWSLANRGSKYWQECWEQKVARYESDITGTVFGETEPVQTNKPCWLRARRYSVSKLSIALSDYVFLLWLCIVLWECWRLFFDTKGFKTWAAVLFVIWSLYYLVLIGCQGRSTTTRSGESASGESVPLEETLCEWLRGHLPRSWRSER